MIRESEHFWFNGRKSTDFNIRNVSIGGGAYEESMSSGKSIIEEYPNNASMPYFQGVQKEPKQFDVSFCFDECRNGYLIDDIMRWLNVDEYQKLYFEGDIDRVFYAMPISDLTLVHNGLEDGYVNITFRCDSPYSFSHELFTPILEMNKVPEQLVEITNLGYYNIRPRIWIKKVSDGDITIHNLTHRNIETKFENIDIDEELIIDGKTEIITTSKEKVHRYDDFNDTYVELIYGKNRLKISDNVKIQFYYEYIFA
ncbi:distal tail protein Dit [Oceanobacillus oncorhynchi]|uniref:distal tail protein Dit n=1 Tax=Oceanobacillus oncorhynchi TaxID=545501 RepID=UPI0034D49DFF